MLNNGMRLIELKKNSPRITCGEWDTIREYIRNEFNGRSASTFVTMQHGICLGSFNQGEFIMPQFLPLDPLYIKAIRVFDADCECYVWRNSMDTKDIFRIRIIRDLEEISADEIMHTIEVRQLLWGRTLKQCPGEIEWYLWKENRGIELLIHDSQLSNDGTSSGNRLWLITRNYIKYNDIGQAGYEDCRFVEISEEGGT